jgi:hypothetical protein
MTDTEIEDMAAMRDLLRLLDRLLLEGVKIKPPLQIEYRSEEQRLRIKKEFSDFDDKWHKEASLDSLR